MTEKQSGKLINLFCLDELDRCSVIVVGVWVWCFGGGDGDGDVYRGLDESLVSVFSVGG